jgi:hypothetical protein
VVTNLAEAAAQIREWETAVSYPELALRES